MMSPVMEKELHHQLNNLPLGQQRQVLEFARALSLTQSHGVPGSVLLPFAGVIEAADLFMSQAADEDCEQIASQDW